MACNAIVSFVECLFSHCKRDVQHSLKSVGQLACISYGDCENRFLRIVTKVVSLQRTELHGSSHLVKSRALYESIVQNDLCHIVLFIADKTTYEPQLKYARSRD